MFLENVIIKFDNIGFVFICVNFEIKNNMVQMLLSDMILVLHYY